LDIQKSKIKLFYLAAALLWLKTYLVHRFGFQLPVESWFQELILLISPLSSVGLLLGVGLLVSRKRKNLSMVIVSLATSGILFANMLYYRFFNDFITLPVLLQATNMGDLGGSIFGLLYWADFLIFLDAAFLIFLVYYKKLPETVIPRPQLMRVFTASIIIFMVNWGMAEIVRPELLTRSFDRQLVVKSIGAYNYHIYDVVVNSKMKTKKVLANSEDIIDAERYLKGMAKDEKSDLYGVAEGKNVFVISMESVQSFVINNEVEGQEITPFLNDFIKESYYFENFYHQTGQGKTSDAEFLLDNSLYPLPSGAVFMTHAQNAYEATPEILKEHGYNSVSFHANDATFWNREEMFKTLGYDQYVSKSYYNITEENSMGWGLKDIDFFEQSMLYLRYLPQPFYSKFITLTNHHPFAIDEEDTMIPEFDSEDGVVNRYFGTVRYTDEALKVFFERIKEQGLYENSIFILYGDHYGISPNHNKALGQYLGKEITPFDQVQLQKVPLIIHIPGHKGQTLDTVSGQIDIRPTLLNLLGIETQKGIGFGHDLFAPNRESFVALRDGSFVTEDRVNTHSVCYDKTNGQEIEKAACDSYRDRAQKELKFSDEIIYGDLMRFILGESGDESRRNRE
jgi:lipoteichoic acid synthase